MKKVLGIIGIGVLGGVVIYELLNKKENKKKYTESYSDNVSKEKNIAIITQEDIKFENEDLEEFKTSVAESIYIRHEDALKNIKETVEKIYQSTEIYEDNKNDLNQISDQLDELIREE